MHIPPYHKKRSWQIVMIGLFFGSIIAYFVLTMMYGKMYENILSEKIELQAKLKDLTRQNEALLRDREQLKEETNYTIQKIKVHILNSDELRLDRLIIHQLKELIINEIDYIIGKEVSSISDSDDILITVLENQTFTIDELSYKFEVKKLTISEQVILSLHVKLAN